MVGPTQALERIAHDPPTVVCLPDLFLDHFVHLEPLDEALDTLRAIHGRGGGNRPARQRYEVGGNAANTAYALAALGARAQLVTRTSELGRRVLEQTLGQGGVDLSLVRTDGELATSTILSFDPDRANVMLNEPGSVARYGPDELGEDEAQAIRRADAVLVANWNNTRAHGTELAEATFRLAREGDALTYLDASDPTSRAEDVPGLLERVTTTDLLDVWAMNEAELAVFAGAAGDDVDGLEAHGQALAAQCRGTLDVHTADQAHSWGPHGHASAEGFEVEVRRTTGAGDAFNAGNLLGHLLGLAPEGRLRLAHATAAAHVAGGDRRPPGPAQVRALFEAST